MKRASSLMLLAALCAGPLRGAYGRELSLDESLKTAEQNSPRLKAARLEERAAHESVGVARSAYYPSVAAEAIDSWGFPGSSSHLGIGGLMGSPYRSGAAAGLVARETLFDFGRTSADIKAAGYAERARREDLEVDRYAVDRDVLETFYDCSRFRSERETWNQLHDEEELVAKEVARFVDIGQRSIVDRYLARAQVEEARTNRNFFKSRMQSTVGRLALLTGVVDPEMTCPALPALDQAATPIVTAPGNPYVARAKTEVDLAQNLVTGAKTEYLPKIVGMASAGSSERVRLVNRADYSGGVGVVVPLFDGLGTVHRVRRAEAERDAKTQELGAVQLRMAEVNAKYDEVIDASKARLEHLVREQKLAQEGFKVAKSRYFKTQGTLVDLRDALRNLGRIETDMMDTQANLLQAMGAKALLNGRYAAQPGQ